MDNLNTEKLLALQSAPSENDHNERYNIPKEKIQVMDHNMKNIAHAASIKEVDGYKTRKRTNKEYNQIWKIFKENYADEFEKYMGYGVAKIEKIGIKEFVDFMDWSSSEDILTYKTDRVKVIPCVHCDTHFTTFQIDLGLCHRCKDKFDLEQFGEMCSASEASNPGSSSGLQIMFCYIEDFRNLYKKDRPLKELIKDAVEVDELSGLFSRDVLVRSVIGKEEDYFVAQCEAYQKKSDTPFKVQNRMVSIINVLKSDINEEEKTNRIESIFKTV